MMTGIFGRVFKALTGGKFTVIGIPYGWFILLVAIPLMIVMKISLSEMEATSVSNMISWTNGLPTLKLNFANYQFIFSDALYVKTYISSIKYALITTLICLAIGYPFAYFMARAPNGSSNNKSLGCLAKLRTKATRCCWPPDS
jgi:putrescine transport system permease protein